MKSMALLIIILIGLVAIVFAWGSIVERKRQREEALNKKPKAYRP
jgi:Flp pilus assembly protein TadG